MKKHRVGLDGGTNIVPLADVYNDTGCVGICPPLWACCCRYVLEILTRGSPPDVNQPNITTERLVTSLPIHW